MFLLPLAWTHETILPSEVGIVELWDTQVLVISGTFIDQICSSLPPPWDKGASISPRALHRPLLLHDQVRAWVEVKARAHKPGLQGPRGVSTPLHLKLSL